MNEFDNMPTSVKVGAGTLGVITIGGVGWFLRKDVLIFLIILAVLLVMFLGGWLLWRSWSRRKKNAQLSGQLQQHTAAAPKGISDPAKRAKLDDLRQKFQHGVSEYRSRGKDLYKLPWYVICGPPGAGKTEAIRHCNVGFPPGMQDSLQGVGGTINMNWWFTNHAVILDTAGKLLFEEVAPGEVSEWREFLTLLKKSRSNCPINGLFLAISVEDLIKDSSESILKKAGKIAQQLDVIQRVLDVRFPVFVIVTKCDLLTGFREFFDDITDPQLQHQMVGWSNPDTLDTSFRPELIDQHLRVVSQRLRGRRLGLLRDPVPENSDHRRTDEVDAMFALPNSLTSIGPRLRRYLETIFVAGEWSAKPLFLRGIYFTSSMREGSALDEELARAIGVPVGELPDGRGWERERAYFLRDLFMEKVFKERGLVTGATNTGQLLRRRRLALFGTGFACMALFVLFCFFGAKSFNKSIGKQAGAWMAAASNWKEDPSGKAGIWQPIVTPGKDQSPSKDQSLSKVVAADGSSLGVNLASFHARLRDLAGAQINYGIFRPIALVAGGDIDPKEMKKAQRIVFERGVIWPLVSETRNKLASASDSLDASALERQTAALTTLIQLEARLLQQGSFSPLAEKEAARFLSSLMAYVTEQSAATADTNLITTMAWLYSQGAAGSEWPPAWLGETNAGNKSVLVPAFRRLMDQSEKSAQTNQAGAEEFSLLRRAFTNLFSAETNLIPKMEAAGSAAELKQAMQPYERALSDWERTFSSVRNTALRGSEFSSVQAYTNSVQKNRDIVKKSLEQTGSVLDLKASSPLFKELRSIVAEKREKLERQLAENSSSDLEGLRALDQWCLSLSFTGHLYQTRAWIYNAAVQATPSANVVVGEKFAPFLAWQAKKAKLEQQIAESGGGASLVRAATNYLQRITQSLAREMLDKYAKDARGRMIDRLDYPILRVNNPARALTLNQVTDARKQMEEILGELSSPTFANLAATAGQPGALADFKKTTELLRDVSSALAPTATCRITLLAPKDAGEADWRNWAIYGLFNETAKKDIPGTGWKDIPEISLDQAVDFKFYKDQGYKTLVDGFIYEKWGAIQMLHSTKTDETEGGASRVVSRTMKNGPMQFELRFTTPVPLPALRNWPTKESVTSGLQ